MAVTLEGGCRVSRMDEGTPQIAGSMRIWSQIGRATGAQAISLRVLEFGHGVSPVIFNHASDEVFYAMEQIENGPSISPSCKVNINGQGFDVAPQTNISATRSNDDR
jgi:hypothetical protein